MGGAWGGGGVEALLERTRCREVCNRRGGIPLPQHNTCPSSPFDAAHIPYADVTPLGRRRGRVLDPVPRGLFESEVRQRLEEEGRAGEVLEDHTTMGIRLCMEGIADMYVHVCSYVFSVFLSRIHWQPLTEHWDRNGLLQ